VDDSAGAPSPPFKTCSMCGKVWRSRQDFLADQEIICIGYQPEFQDVELGLFQFNHATCGTTLAISASRFTDLHTGPVFEARLTGTTECPGYCLRQDDLRPCPARCSCAYVREVLDRLVRWEKTG